MLSRRIPSSSGVSFQKNPSAITLAAATAPCVAQRGYAMDVLIAASPANAHGARRRQPPSAALPEPTEEPPPQSGSPMAQGPSLPSAMCSSSTQCSTGSSPIIRERRRARAVSHHSRPGDGDGADGVGLQVGGGAVQSSPLVVRCPTLEGLCAS